MNEKDEIFLSGSGALCFQGLFIGCSGSVSGCEPVLLNEDEQVCVSART